VSATFGAEDVRGDIPLVVGCLTTFDDQEARAVMAEKVALVERMEDGGRDIVYMRLENIECLFYQYVYSLLSVEVSGVVYPG